MLVIEYRVTNRGKKGKDKNNKPINYGINKVYVITLCELGPFHN